MLTYLEISKSSLLNNISEHKKLLDDEKIMAVVKANAYGHGLEQVVPVIESHVDAFQLDSYLELVELRKRTDKKAFVLGYIPNNELENALKLGCVPCAYTVEGFRKADEIGKKHKKVYDVHLKIDAQLGRQGVLVPDLDKFLSVVKKFKNVNIAGAYSHFSDLKDPQDLSHSTKQIDKYRKALEILNTHGYKNLVKHITSSAGIYLKEKLDINFDYVRLGTGLYGIYPSKALAGEFEGELNLKPALTWKTEVAQVKTVPANYPISYGLTYVTKEQTKIAIIPVGYSDGYDRKFSNNGEVLINGSKVPVIGRIAMNMFVVDVSGVKNVKAGDEVVLIGNQGSGEISAADHAEKIDTIHYEILSRISSNLTRVLIE